jgi:FkbM family methyltransferase
MDNSYKSRDGRDDNQVVTYIIAQFVRFIQSLSKNRPIKGFYRLHKFLNKHLPRYKGTIKLSDGIHINLDPSRSGLEKWVFYTGIYEITISKLLLQNAPINGVCLDIGAHLGMHTLKLARKVGPNGKVFSFEVNPLTAKELAANIERNGFKNVEIINKAVHNCSGIVVPIHIRSLGMNSMYEDHDTSSYTNIIQADTISIDDFMKDYDRVDVIKIDIEGNDFNAIIGAKETIRKYKPFISFEFSSDVSYQIVYEAFDFLQSCSYSFMKVTESEKLMCFSGLEIKNLYENQKETKSKSDIVCFPLRS